MSKKKRYSMIFYLSENTWSMSGIPCPDCVDESNYPEYAMKDLTEVFEQLAKEGKLPEDVNAYLHEAWKEIEGKCVLVGQTVHCFCGIRISSENQLTNIS